MNLLILGAGGFASEVEELARTLGYDDISFLDDNPEGSKCNPIIGCLDDCHTLVSKFKYAIVALGNNETRAFWHKNLLSIGYEIPSLISPLSYISRDATILPGCIVRQFCVVGRNAFVGQATILNVNSVVDHDCKVGDFSHLLIGSIVRGNRNLPAFTRLGANEIEQ